MKKIIFSFVFAASLVSQAALVSFEKGTKDIEGVNLNKSATMADGSKIDLLGAGLRVKKVLFVNAKVYVLQLFSDNKAGFAHDAGALTSLATGSQTVVLKISMLRTVEAASLATSFQEALDANGYAIDAELTKVLAVIENGADGIQGKDLTLLLTKNADPSKVDFHYEDAAGKQQNLTASASVMTKVLSIWLGIPADKGLESLKTELLNPVY